MATPGTITKNTVIPISLVIVILGAALWLDRRLSKIEFRLEIIQTDISNRTGDRWSSTDMEHWTDLLALSNPDMIVPLPGGSE